MRADRRDFLKGSLAASTLMALGDGTIPGFLASSAKAASDSAPSDKILVVIQLIGGNDGLNTVIPHGIDGYSKYRQALRISSAQVQTVTKEIGLHPRMSGMAKLHEAGQLSIIQGVGYPNPDRSHFRSMEIWETARTETGALETGWLGRTLDARIVKPGEDAPGLHIGGGSLPLGLRTKRTEVPSLENIEQYRLNADNRTSRDAIRDVAKMDRPGDDPLLGFLRRNSLAAYESSRRIEEMIKSSSESSDYPKLRLAKRLELIAKVIKAGFGTRIYYTSLDGFDTHANQLGVHENLLGELSDSVSAFHRDLTTAGQADRVAILAFSEFGRRVAENASRGTDHGSAAPVFVMGPVAKPGLVGDHPKFDDLDDGDLKHHTDFRNVYASILDDWMGVPSRDILGPGFSPLPLFKKA